VTAAPLVVALADGTTHLRNAPAQRAWCGADVRGGVDFVWEPGCDWGEDKRDCLDCVRALVRLRDGNAGAEQ